MCSQWFIDGKNPRHFDIHTWTDQCSRLCTDNCLTRAANATLLIGTTFLYIDTLAPQPATKMLVLSVYHNLPSCPMKNWYTRGDSYEDQKLHKHFAELSRRGVLFDIFVRKDSPSRNLQSHHLKIQSGSWILPASYHSPP